MKTSELTGPALDWAVALCECGEAWRNEDVDPHFYSTDWAIGGPIIEREEINIRRSNGQWIAEWWPDNSGMAKKPSQRFVHNRHMAGPTALIAAMRCYVASRLGDEVDIPKEIQTP